MIAAVENAIEKTKNNANLYESFIGHTVLPRCRSQRANSVATGIYKEPVGGRVASANLFRRRQG